MNAPSSETNGFCPKCGAQGKAVKPVTLQSLLKPDALARSGSATYRFCPNERCEVVYFADRGGPIFPKAELKVRVGIKETAAPRPLCYCFDHTAEEIDDELHLTGKTTVLDDIKARMKEACWCEAKNPQGSCCLSTVTRYVKAALDGKGAVAAHEKPVEHSARVWTSTAGISMIGSVASAVFASACCWLPLLLLALGVSGVAVGAAFERYRPLFLGTTFAFLGVAFYFTYRSRPKPTSNVSGTQEGGSCCAAEQECCPPSVERNWTLRRFNRSILWIVTAIVLVFALFPKYVGLFFGDSRPPTLLNPRNDIDAAVIAIEGMTCKACARTLQKELATIPGVMSADVTYETRQAVVSLPNRNSAVLSKVLATIKSAGYGGRFVDLEQEMISLRDGSRGGSDKQD